jgi:hypothetical protein
MNSALERREIIGWCAIQRMALSTFSVCCSRLCQRGPTQTSRPSDSQCPVYGSDIWPRPLGVRPYYDDELGRVEAFGLDPGAAWRRTGLSWAVSLHAVSATKQRWAYSSWSADMTQRTRLEAMRGGQTPQ